MAMRRISPIFSHLLHNNCPGWLDCPGAGEPVVNLIPSKVPLGETFNELLDPGRRYSKKHVVRHQQALGRKVGWSFIQVPQCLLGILYLADPLLKCFIFASIRFLDINLEVQSTCLSIIWGYESCNWDHEAMVSFCCL